MDTPRCDPLSSSEMYGHKVRQDRHIQRIRESIWPGLGIILFCFMVGIAFFVGIPVLHDPGYLDGNLGHAVARVAITCVAGAIPGIMLIHKRGWEDVETGPRYIKPPVEGPLESRLRSLSNPGWGMNGTPPGARPD